MRPVMVPSNVADQDCLTITLRMVKRAASRKRRSSEWVKVIRVVLET
jgi:ribosomal protein L31E